MKPGDGAGHGDASVLAVDERHWTANPPLRARMRAQLTSLASRLEEGTGTGTINKHLTTAVRRFLSGT